jgi:hypothetical protein
VETGGGMAGVPVVLAHLPTAPTVITVDCTTVYVAPYEIGVVTAVSLADGSQRTLNPISANSLAMDATRVYSVSPGGGNEPQGLVISCPKTGCSPSYTTLATGQDAVWGVAVDDQNVYWTNQGGDAAVEKAPLTGGPAVKLTPVGSADNIVVAAGTVAYSGGGGLMSVPTTGGSPSVLFAPANGNSVSALATDGSNVYFTTTDGIVGRVPLGGGTAVTLATGQGNPTLFGLAVNSSNVYWASGANGTIVTAPIGGGAVDDARERAAQSHRPRARRYERLLGKHGRQHRDEAGADAVSPSRGWEARVLK